jgi:hypothetical protein
MCCEYMIGSTSGRHWYWHTMFGSHCSLFVRLLIGRPKHFLNYGDINVLMAVNYLLTRIKVGYLTTLQCHLCPFFINPMDRLLSPSLRNVTQNITLITSWCHKTLSLQTSYLLCHDWNLLHISAIHSAKRWRAKLNGPEATATHRAVNIRRWLSRLITVHFYRVDGYSPCAHVLDYIFACRNWETRSSVNPSS